MFLKNFLNTNICLISVIIQKIQNFFIQVTKNLLAKWKTCPKETNTAKVNRVNTATEFNEFKDTLFTTKVVTHKMRRIQSKKHKIGTHEINKTSLSCFDDKRYVLNDGIQRLAYFHKDLKNRFSQMIIDSHR